MKAKILIADDEARWRRLVRDFLTSEGYQVIEAEDGAAAVALTGTEQPDLVILDVMMPNMDGTEACRKIREFSRVPILMCTAKGDEESELLGFTTGADEYIAKPMRFPVFMARVQALLKRAGTAADALEAAGIVLNVAAHTVTANGRPVELTPREFELLHYLMQNRNLALSREQILSAVWNFDYFGDARTVDTHVKNLRMKLGDAGAAIRTVRGRGYKLESEP